MRYRVYMRTGAFTSIDVEADTEEEAVKQAYEQTPSLCAHCSGWGGQPAIELTDWETIDIDWPASPGETAVVPIGDDE